MGAQSFCCEAAHLWLLKDAVLSVVCSVMLQKHVYMSSLPEHKSVTLTSLLL